MATVDAEKFLTWADQYFAGDIKVSKREIKANSPFTDDSKHKLWMNPSGGLKGISAGVYRCWKTDRKGNLISLVSELEKIPYHQAEDLICSELSLSTLEEQLENFLNKKNDTKKILSQLTLPEHTFKIAEMSDDDIYKPYAVKYLEQRKLPIDDLYICVDGDYKNRIIIPYFDQYGTLVYFNGRLISKKKDIQKYKFPSREEIGIGKGDVIYAKKWPIPGEEIFLTEGEFDAISLTTADLCGAAIGGKTLSEEQLEIIRNYSITLAFDSDSSGKEATMVIGKQLLSSGFNNVFYVSPKLKDWNDQLIAEGPVKLREYVLARRKIFTFTVGNDLLFDKIRF